MSGPGLAENMDRANLTFPHQPLDKHGSVGADFKIAVSGGDDSDSIFQEGIASGFEQEAPDNFSSDENDYGEEAEAQNLQMQPRQLPLETILEENSTYQRPYLKSKAATEIRVEIKADQKAEAKPEKKAIIRNGVRLTSSARKRSDSKSKRDRADISDSELKLAEADAYLRKLQQKNKKLKLHDPELSQMSSWTGESVINLKSGADKRKHASLPDSETLLEDILVLRQTRNINEEQVRLLKVSLARMKKLNEKLTEQLRKAEFE